MINWLLLIDLFIAVLFLRVLFLQIKLSTEFRDIYTETRIAFIANIACMILILFILVLTEEGRYLVPEWVASWIDGIGRPLIRVLLLIVAFIDYMVYRDSRFEFIRWKYWKYKLNNLWKA